MKKIAKKLQQPSKLVNILYDRHLHGWVIKGKQKPVFTAQIDLENYCRNKLGLIPVATDPVSRRTVRKFYQQLPTSSVWTGAPWDRTFAK